MRRPRLRAEASDLATRHGSSMIFKFSVQSLAPSTGSVARLLVLTAVVGGAAPAALAQTSFSQLPFDGTTPVSYAQVSPSGSTLRARVEAVPGVALGEGAIASDIGTATASANSDPHVGLRISASRRGSGPTRAGPASRRTAAASRPASTASSARLSSRVSPSPIRMSRRPASAHAENPTRSPDRSMRPGRLMRAGKPRASSASTARGSTRRAFSPSAASRSRRAATPTRSASARPAPSAIAFASPPRSARRS